MTVTAQALAGLVNPAGVHTHIPQRPAFTSSSSPSDTDVMTLIQTTANAVVGAVGGSLADSLSAYAATVVEVGTAAKVEQGYWPEQQVGNASTAEMLWTEYNDNLTRLVAQALRLAEAGGPGRAFGQIGLHKRTAKLWQAQEIAASLPEIPGVPSDAVIIDAEDVVEDVLPEIDEVIPENVLAVEIIE